MRTQKGYKHMSTSRQIALLHADLANMNLGVQEEGINDGPAVRAYQQSCKPPVDAHGPWCAAHVRYRMKQAATQLGITYDETFPRSGYCPDWSRWYREKQLWLPAHALIQKTTVRMPRKGDHALFYFKQLSRIAHIGIVWRVESWGVYTIEGNTSPEPSDETCVERDGDGIYMKRRDWAELGQYGGFGLLDF